MAKSATVRKIESADNNNIVNLQLLSEIALGKVRYVAKTPDAEVLLLHNPPLIEINIHEPDPSDKSKVACRVTTAGAALLTANQNPVIEKVENKMSYEIIDDAELPPIKRGGGGGGAPTKYPFDALEVGKSFFVPATAKLPNPLKTLGSTISSANHRYAKVTGEKVVERSKRGARNKLVLDANGNKIMETKNVPTYEFTRKFTIRGVKAGVKYGNWVAPADGALIARVR
jgi:hypothetical protein